MSDYDDWDDYDDETPGIKIGTQIEFQNYIADIINNEDNFQDERKKMCKLLRLDKHAYLVFWLYLIYSFAVL